MTKDKEDREDLMEKFGEELKKSNIKPKNILEILEFLDDENMFSNRGIKLYHKFLKDYSKSKEVKNTRDDFDFNFLEDLGRDNKEEDLFNIDLNKE